MKMAMMSEVEEPGFQLWSTEELKPYERNAKRHPEEQINGIVESIKNFGWKANPVEVTKDGTIVNGHGRWMATKQLGLDRIPVVVIEGLSESEVKAYRLAHNRVAEGGNDANILTMELTELMGDGLDMSLYFNDRELQFSLEDMGELDVSALSSDLASQIDAAAGDTQGLIDSEDDLEFNGMSVTRTLGFSKTNTTQQRSLKRLLMVAESETGDKGAEALHQYIRETLGL